jgi:hypothetical protein
MPMLELPDVPAIYAGKQVRWLLHWSEIIFPKINAVGTVPNLLLAVTCFLKRHDSRVAALKWPVLAAAFACNVGATAWTLVIMSPINNGMRKFSQAVEDRPDDERAEKEFRRLQKKWRAYAYGECVILVLVDFLREWWVLMLVCRSCDYHDVRLRSGDVLHFLGWSLSVVGVVSSVKADGMVNLVFGPQ